MGKKSIFALGRAEKAGQYGVLMWIMSHLSAVFIDGKMSQITFGEASGGHNAFYAKPVTEKRQRPSVKNGGNGRCYAFRFILIGGR